MFLNLKEWIIKKVVQRKVEKKMNDILGKLAGKKTYLLAVFGIFVAVIGHYFGPIHVGPVEIPQLTSAQMWDAIWNGGLFAFLRKGVSSNAAPQ